MQGFRAWTYVTIVTTKLQVNMQLVAYMTYKGGHSYHSTVRIADHTELKI